MNRHLFPPPDVPRYRFILSYLPVQFLGDIIENQPNQKDLERIYELLEELKTKAHGVGSDKIVEAIHHDLQNKVEPYTIPIIISEQEREPIPLVRADRLHIIEEYRAEQNKWFAICLAFAGAACGVIVNWVTGEPTVITHASIIVIAAFCIVSLLCGLSALSFKKRAEKYKHIILYGGNSTGKR